MQSPKKPRPPERPPLEWYSKTVRLQEPQLVKALDLMADSALRWGELVRHLLLKAWDEMMDRRRARS